jgi:hypothetical protein
MMTFMKISMQKKYQLAVILALLVSLLMSNARAETLIVPESINHMNFDKKLVRSIWGDDIGFIAALGSNGQDQNLQAKKSVGCTLQVSMELMNGKMLDLFSLNLAAGDLERNILMHIAKENENYVELMRQYFAKAQEDYRKFQLKTYFNPKKLIVKPQKLEILIEGVLVNLFDDYGHEQKEAFYQISFIRLGEKLLIKEFKSIAKEAKEEMK